LQLALASRAGSSLTATACSAILVRLVANAGFAVAEARELPKERVGERVFVFFSESYASTTATVIFTADGTIVVDTLPFPNEARELAAFARRGGRRVAYLINTHSHLDHVAANHIFSEAELVAHARTREALAGPMRQALAQAAATFPELRDVELRLPTITLRNEGTIRHGGITVHLLHLPGHTYDAIGAYVEEERTLIAGDAVLPLPHFAGADPDSLMRTLLRLRSLSIHTIVQGHGDVILKGEVKEAIEARINYLRQVRKYVASAVAQGASLEEVQSSGVEAFGGSRLDLDGLTQQLHEANIAYLYDLYTRKEQPSALRLPAEGQQ
jgi:glyoxylase-like metal-dependent hydrolase (beta-lactamase superfamily II)